MAVNEPIAEGAGSTVWKVEEYAVPIVAPNVSVTPETVSSTGRVALER